MKRTIRHQGTTALARRLGWLVAATPLVAGADSASATPIIQFSFSSGNLNNTGSAGGTGSFVDAGGAQPTVTANAGPKGSGDWAMNNESANGMGNQATTGGWMEINVGTALDSLQSFTVTSWIKSQDQPGNGARLMTKRYQDPENSFGVAFAAGQTYLYVDGSVSNPAISDAVLNGGNVWEFIAVAYDGTSSSNNVRFYSGNASSTTLNAAGVRTLDRGVVGNTGLNLRIGGFEPDPTLRPFDGFIDDFRIYGSTVNETGALSQAEVTAVFLAGHPVPEPSTLVLATISLVVAAGTARRIWRRLSSEGTGGGAAGRVCQMP